MMIGSHIIAEVTAGELTFWGGIGAVVVAILTVIFTKGVDGWINIRKADREDRAAGDGAVTKGYEIALAKMDLRVDAMEKALRDQNARYDDLQVKHLECQKSEERLKMKIEAMEKRLSEFDRSKDQNTRRIQDVESKVKDAGL